MISRRLISTFLSDIVETRHVTYELAKRDFRQQYQGTYLGFLWMFLQPVLFILILYIIITIGFKAGAPGEMPFSLYLVSGMIAWLYFSENLTRTVSIIQNYSYLVKNLDFRLSILPLVRILSTLIPHIVLIVLGIALAWYQGYPPTLYTLQVLYYLGAMISLLLGLGWLTASTSLFVRDVSKFVSLAVQFGFWLTPIFWQIEVIPTQYQWLIKINPAYYIVTGYRDSLVLARPFWHRPDDTLLFWAVTLVVILVGIATYRKLRPHIPEVV